jgi:hypothetical protein
VLFSIRSCYDFVVMNEKDLKKSCRGFLLFLVTFPNTFFVDGTEKNLISESSEDKIVSTLPHLLRGGIDLSEGVDNANRVF